MAAKILVLLALLAVSVSGTTATSFLQYPPSMSAAITSIPCVQYATLHQVLATGGISPHSAIALQRSLNLFRQQCSTHLSLQGAISLPQQQALSIVQQQIVQQQLVPILLQQAQQQQQVQQQQLWSIVQRQVLQQQLVPLLLQQQQQQQQVLPILLQQVQQQLLLPYLINMMNAVNPAACGFRQQQLLSNPFNPAAFYAQAQQQQLWSMFNQQAAFEQQQLSPYFLNALAAMNPAAAYYRQQSFSAGACF